MHTSIREAKRSPDRRRTGRLLGAVAAVGTAAAYMVWEAQWVRCRCLDLPVPGLPPAWTGLTILHLSDVHAGLFPGNERALQKAITWATPLTPDLVFLTGDILGARRRSRRCLDLLAHLRPPLGYFAVTGNHEYGLGKGPLAAARYTKDLWTSVGVTLLQDECVDLPPRGGRSLVVGGADYLSAGFGLLTKPSCNVAAHAFSLLLIHEPPPTTSPLSALFDVAFAGHTHGGQLRIPGRHGLVPLNEESDPRLGGVYDWGEGQLVVSRGIGTSFVPFRLLTPPEATLWRLV
jgi:predicted MPP superfamily phosphohydrolase